MNKLDYLILSDLLKYAQMSFTTIAKKLASRRTPSGNAYQKMKKDGIIKHSIVSIDLAKLGYQGKVF